MLCNVLLLARSRLAAIAGAVVMIGVLSYPLTAFADRKVYFEALGHSEITDYGKKLGYYNTATGMGNDTGLSTLHTKCKITITNSGPNDQKITVAITGTATGSESDQNGVPSGSPDIITTGANPATYTAKDQDGHDTSPLIDASGNLTNYTLQPNKQVNIVVTYPPPHYLYQTSQDARCSGNITVSDSVATNSGFVVANGMMTTWSQGTSAYQANGSSGQMRAEVRYYYTPFTIGGGRAF